MLYTRRIGETVESPALPDGFTQLRPAGAAPVLAAAKLLANVGGVQFGALSAVTGGVEAVTDQGDVSSVSTATHHVARARITRNRLAIGGLATIARWEYRPGSTAFLVYSHAQAPDDTSAGFEPRSLVRGPASDVVLLKLSWAWLR